MRLGWCCVCSFACRISDVLINEVRVDEMCLSFGMSVALLRCFTWSFDAIYVYLILLLMVLFVCSFTSLCCVGVECGWDCGRLI